MRVFDSLEAIPPEGKSGIGGNWIMKQEDIAGLTADEIHQLYALPNQPLYVSKVTIPANTTIRTGICGPIEGFGNGGGLQFDLMGSAKSFTFEYFTDIPISEPLQF